MLDSEVNSNKRVVKVQDLDVYRAAFDAAMVVFEITKSYPKEERYSLIDQIRRSSGAVCANLAEAWQKRLYEAAFVAKLSDSLAEASETQTWIEFSVKCHYLEVALGRELFKTYDQVIGRLIRMSSQPYQWLIRKPT